MGVPPRPGRREPGAPAAWEHIRAAKENVDVVAGAIEDPLLKKTFLASSQIAPIVEMYGRLRELQPA